MRRIAIRLERDIRDINGRSLTIAEFLEVEGICMREADLRK